MGLDSVELIMSIERSFGIDIPDDIAMTLSTSGQVVDYVSLIRNLDTQPTAWERESLRTLALAIQEFRGLSNPPERDDDISAFFATDPQLTAEFLSHRLNLEVPELPSRKRSGPGRVLGGLLARLGWNAEFAVRLRNLNDAINARNLVVEPGMRGLKTSYDAYLAVMCLLEHRLGLDLLILDPDKSFIDDYGID